MKFEDELEYVRTNRQIDGHKFNNATDIGNMIDFHNQQREKKSENYAGNEIHEISKFLARTLYRKSFIGGKKEEPKKKPMSKLSVIIPSRNSQFLTKTIKDVLEKAEEDIEVIINVDENHPEELVEDPRVQYFRTAAQ